MKRLEEIKEEYKGFIEMENDENYEESLEIAMWLVDGHLHWLIKQAERVEGLEEELTDETLVRKGYEYALDKYKAENNRYKQALEEIERAKEKYTGFEYPEAVDEIACKALGRY